MSVSKEFALKIVDLLEDKKANDITVIDVEGISPIADCFVIATGTSSTHINALSDHLSKELKEDLKHREGKVSGGWILLDFKDVIVHVFTGETRAYYSLERVWSDAPRVALHN
ncbi:ribosome silencing factor [Fusibacter tunisiensis]|uniref:Ribosomal silencing factor RsfS n=1 Tax=Fusibacter tunisiensis TaxID=1008308 RepID=A0ABS2MMW9_9FIRM|nr:ribosome silencing factor [Fusibacter tunisiensis]MBM7560744.1 ribosome-associated protein [Fusibacter tunisiensis]